MRIAWGIAVTLLSLLAWGGQTISWLAPETAVKYSLMEPEDSVEPAFWADIRGEALWDALALWTMMVAGVLLIADHSAWPYFGLVGGGMYLYFAGRGIVTRRSLLAGGFRVGDAHNARVGLIALALWGVMALVTIAVAVVELEG